jgi:hypothetical protein
LNCLLPDFTAAAQCRQPLFWPRQNGEAIYDTVPWPRAEGKSREGDHLRFTRKGGSLYAVLVHYGR